MSPHPERKSRGRRQAPTCAHRSRRMSSPEAGPLGPPGGAAHPALTAGGAEAELGPTSASPDLRNVLIPAARLKVPGKERVTLAIRPCIALTQQGGTGQRAQEPARAPHDGGRRLPGDPTSTSPEPRPPSAPGLLSKPGPGQPCCPLVCSSAVHPLPEAARPPSLG